MSSKKSAALPDGFVPGEMDVIVGRGKVCYKHSGNQRLTKIVQGVLTTYSAKDATKKSKSELIKSIMVQIRSEGSPNAGFVKFDNESGQWFEVGDRIAREKVSQTFRDALNDRYKSSTTSKTLRRRQERINRGTSTGSKDEEHDGSNRIGRIVNAHHQRMIEKHEISGAQARVDALLMAANASSSHAAAAALATTTKHPTTVLPPTFSGLPPLTTAGLSSSLSALRPVGLLPPPPTSLGLMTPSLTSLMAENVYAAAAARPTYGQMFLNRQRDLMMKRSLMGSYPSAAAAAAAVTTTSSSSPSPSPSPRE